MDPKHDGQLWISTGTGQLRCVHVDKEAVLITLERVQQHVPVWTHRTFSQRISNALPRSLGQGRPEPATSNRGLAIFDSAKAVVVAGDARLVDLVAPTQKSAGCLDQDPSFVLWVDLCTSSNVKVKIKSGVQSRDLETALHALKVI